MQPSSICSTAGNQRAHRLRHVAGRLIVAAFVSALLVDAHAAPPRGGVSGVLADEKGPVVVFLEGARVPGQKPQDHEILQVNRTFVPNQLVVGVGDRVSFPNKDQVSHNVFSPSRSNVFDFGLYRPGASRDRVFSSAGIVDIFCDIHQEMHATISVVPSDYYAVSDAQGTFQVTGVPAGKYTAVVWRKGKEIHRQPVEVAAGTNTKIDVVGQAREK